MCELAIEEQSDVSDPLLYDSVLTLALLQTYADIDQVKVAFDVAECDGDSLYTYLPNWLNSLTDEQLRAPPMSANTFQKYIRQSHLESTMANGVRKMALK